MNVRKLFLLLSFMIVSCGNDLAPQSFPEQTLVADGNDEATYSLILNKGYNYETPDNSGAHSFAPYRHIRQSFDESLGKYVFDFILHIENDDDRGKANIKDRQRNEIKTDAKSPDNMVAQKGSSCCLKACRRQRNSPTSTSSRVSTIQRVMPTFHLL
mgnify:CR=1 FL=1